jgi:hypothetical protein
MKSIDISRTDLRGVGQRNLEGSVMTSLLKAGWFFVMALAMAAWIPRQMGCHGMVFVEFLFCSSVQPKGHISEPFGVAQLSEGFEIFRATSNV